MSNKQAGVASAIFGFVALAAVLMGSGCGPPLPPLATSCCTKGDSGSAYYTLGQECPAGYKAISSTDKQNAALYATCLTRHPFRRPGAVALGLDAPTSTRTIPTNVAPAARSCFSECPPGLQNAHCIDAGTAPATYSPQLSQVVTTLMKQTTARIEPSSFSQALRLAPNAATRGAIVLQAAQVTNEGSPMRLEASAPALGAIALIELPSKVEATLERRGAFTVFRFSQTSADVSVRLLNAANRAAHPLDGTAAGRVLAVETNGQTVYLQTTSACLSTALPATAPNTR